jgi:AcrR family transcriptional regulator
MPYSAYSWLMPKLWNDTVQEHRSSMREAVLDAVAELVAAGGVSAVSMTKAAEGAEISRVTLYKYFPDVEALLAAWHERQVEQHLGHLHHVRAHLDNGGSGLSPVEAVRAVLEAYALMLQETLMAGSPNFLHSSPHVGHAQEHLQNFLSAMIDEARVPASGTPGPSPVIRSDMTSEDLASFALHAVNAAAAAPTPDSVRALVGVIVDGMTRHQ